MGLIDPQRIPTHLNTRWAARGRVGARILFWTTFIWPLFASLAEFSIRVFMPLVGSKDAGTSAMAWDRLDPHLTLATGLVLLIGVWMISAPEPGAGRRTRTHRALRPVCATWLFFCMMRSAAAVAGFRLAPDLSFWVYNLLWTGAAALTMLFVGQLAERLDQYALKLIAGVMTFYILGRLGVRALSTMLLGTEVGAVVNPVFAMGDLAIALVAMVGFLMVVGKLHRALKIAVERSGRTKPDASPTTSLSDEFPETM